ncbi:MAG: 3-hydroxyacyl-ACP dehydratase FabZ family protein [Promethearchaeota archaeon]|jgi:3-hydroxyacyl-[acyl-carrier-protein] dehydratase
MRFLFYDKILLLEKKRRIVGIKNVALDEEYLTGHFQKEAIMPGTILLEALAQVAGWLIIVSMDFRVSAIMTLVEDVKFYKKIIPGDSVFLEAEILNLQYDASEAKGNAKVNDKEVMSMDRILFVHYHAPDKQYIQHEKERFKYFSGGFYSRVDESV